MCLFCETRHLQINLPQLGIEDLARLHVHQGDIRAQAGASGHCEVHKENPVNRLEGIIPFLSFFSLRNYGTALIIQASVQKEALPCRLHLHDELRSVIALAIQVKHYQPLVFSFRLHLRVLDGQVRDVTLTIQQ